MPEIHTHDDLHKKVKNTNMNTYIKDSTYVRERKGSPHPSAYSSPWRGGEGIGCCDTITIEHWHTEVRDSVVESHDTVRIVERDSIPYEVEVPVEMEKPLPKWVRKSIAAFVTENVLIVAVIAAVVAIRIRRRRYPSIIT